MIDDMCAEEIAYLDEVTLTMRSFMTLAAARDQVPVLCACEDDLVIADRILFISNDMARLLAHAHTLATDAGIRARIERLMGRVAGEIEQAQYCIELLKMKDAVQAAEFEALRCTIH